MKKRDNSKFICIICYAETLRRKAFFPSKIFAYILFAFFSFQTLVAQESHYFRLKIDLQNIEIKKLAALGLAVDHGEHVRGKYYIGDFSSREKQKLERSQIPFEVLIRDLSSFYAQQANDDIQIISSRADTVFCESYERVYSRFLQPENYELGTMGGFHKMAEMESMLDEMYEKFPNLMTERAPIGDIQTYEGRNIFWLKISDNPAVDEDEPEVLYTALHHAREPGSLSQMLFFMWYLLENYGKDPEITFLIDNTELYFIPMINPDGYAFNERFYPNGGGLWRKNRRPINDTAVGVDLNRNYGFSWGLDDIGSSSDPTSQVYRGEAPFSEAETQAVKLFCENHEFQVALNYHTSGELLIHPWGFDDSLTEDDPTFKALGDWMSHENHFAVGTGLETVGYLVNGDSDDWMYGETSSKNAILSLTPEMGQRRFGFWPPASEVIELNQSGMFQNLATAHSVHTYLLAREEIPTDIVSQVSGTFTFRIQNVGLQAGEVQVSLQAANEAVIASNQVFTLSLAHLEDTLLDIPYQVQNTLADGEELRFLLTLNYGDFSIVEPLQKTWSSSPYEIIFSDDGSDLSQWSSSRGTWGIENRGYLDESSISDSPDGNYLRDQSSALTMREALDLRNVTQARFRFRTQYKLELNYDYVQVLASTDPQFGFQPLCTRGGKAFTLESGITEPVLHGTQNTWFAEEVDLSAYIGQQVYLRFYFFSDRFSNLDGIRFDDLVVEVVRTPATEIGDELPVGDFRIFPNPNSGVFSLTLDENLAAQGNVQVHIFDLVGRSVLGQVVDRKNLSIDLSGQAKGLYYVRLTQNDDLIGIRKVLVQ